MDSKINFAEERGNAALIAKWIFSKQNKLKTPYHKTGNRMQLLVTIFIDSKLGIEKQNIQKFY